MRRYLTEFVGMVFFVMTIGLVTAAGTPLAPLIIGSVLMVIVYMGGPVSGGHFNPAVTLAAYLGRKMNRGDLVPYWIAQVVGGLAGASLSRMFVDRTFTIAPATTTTAGAALLVELLYTTLLALTVLNCATRESIKGNSYYGLAIGFSIVVAAASGGPISGGAFNPGIGAGAIVVDALLGGGSLGHLWIYLVGPLAGGALAAAVFRAQGEGGQ
jgi:aquaporin Z